MSFTIRPELAVFWRDNSTIQIGLDPRCGVVIKGLTHAEQDFISSLTKPTSAEEADSRARRMGIDSDRTAQMLRMLQRAGVLKDSPVPDLNLDVCVRIENLDPLGVSIGLSLVRAGIGSLVFSDQQATGPFDHPALVRRGYGLSRSSAMLTAIRSENPSIRSSGTPQLVVVSASRWVFPHTTGKLCSDSTPHLLAWTEEFDTCVGPIVEPGSTACAGCLDEMRRQSDPAWPILSAQILMSTPIFPHPLQRDLAGDLAARSVLGFLAGKGNCLREATWRIGPGVSAPRQVAAVPHPGCGCSAHSLLLSHLEAALPRPGLSPGTR